MLRRLSVRNFKSLRDITVEFPRLAVLFGPNAAGKSNLIEAIQALSWLGNARTLQDALGLPFPVRGFAFEAFSSNPDGFPAQFAKGADCFTVESDLETENGTYRYRVEPQIDYRTGELGVADEYLARLGVSGRPKGNPEIERVGSVLRARRKGKGSRPREETVGVNHTLLSDRSLSGNGYEGLDHVRAELADWRTYYLEPRMRMRQEQAPAAVQDIGIHGEYIASFLYYLRGTHPKHFEAVSRGVRSIVPSIERVNLGLNEQRGTLDLSVRQAGMDCSARVLSEGTMRVLALSAVAASPWSGSVLTLEEPANGVHPRRLQRIAKVLLHLSMERQVIVSTHSPILVDEILNRIREGGETSRIGLFNVRLGENGTAIEPFDVSGPLFKDREILAALSERSEDGVFEGLVLRGLLAE